MIKVAVHCGSAFVKGKARNYRYYIASSFTLHQCKNGKLVWVNTGIHTNPRRSFNLCKDDAVSLASKYKELGLEVKVEKTYGSWHNRKFSAEQSLS